MYQSLKCQQHYQRLASLTYEPTHLCLGLKHVLDFNLDHQATLVNMNVISI